MKKVFCIVWIVCGLGMAIGQTEAQPKWEGTTLGVFISSRSLSYHPDFHLEVAQFLKIEEDRSNVGRMKSEFIIRLGELLVPQLQRITGADSVLFLNADMIRGRDFVACYDTNTATLINPTAALQELSAVWVLEPFDLRSRVHNSVFIRSNRMVTERIPIKRTFMTISRVDPRRKQDTETQKICYDDLQKDKPDWIFDLLKEDSRMGMYLSQVFSQWWLQETGQLESDCK